MENDPPRLLSSLQDQACTSTMGFAVFVSPLSRASLPSRPIKRQNISQGGIRPRVLGTLREPQATRQGGHQRLEASIGPDNRVVSPHKDDAGICIVPPTPHHCLT